jgi:hypothetical protein
MIRFIERQSQSIFNASEKLTLINRIKRTQLILPPPASVYQDDPQLLTKSEVFYERDVHGNLFIKVGGAYVLFAKSWFNQIFTFAHELGHSIDPCEIRTEALSFPAYNRLSACFIDHKLVTLRTDRTECGKNDQLSETFADWIAVQLTAQSLKTFSTEFQGTMMTNAIRNSVRDLCDEEFDAEFHPSPRVRIEDILGKHPEIQRILGCDVGNKINDYCKFLPNKPTNKGDQYGK